MPLLFSYGTLQQDSVQRATFGRLLNGTRDSLPGFAPARVKIDDPMAVAAGGATHYENAVFNGDDASSVDGMVFEVTDAELAAADRYEAGAAYERIAVTLASGTRCWVYVCARSGSTSA